MTHENFIQSNDEIDPVWQEERRRDIEFTHALLGTAEHMPEPVRKALIVGLINGGLATHGSTGLFPNESPRT